MTCICMRDSTGDTAGDTRKCVTHRGWVVVAACFGINALMLGYIKCFGILYVEFIEEFHATASVTSLVMGMTSASTSIMSLVVLNALMERVTIRKLAITGAVFVSAGVLLCSCAVNIHFLLFSQSFLVGSAQGLLYGPGIVLIGQYFDQKLTLATSIATSGVGAGAILLPLLLRYLLDEYGLRGALLILSGVMMEILVLAGLYKAPDYHDGDDNSDDGTHTTQDKPFLEKEILSHGSDSDTKTSGYGQCKCMSQNDFKCQLNADDSSLDCESDVGIQYEMSKCSEMCTHRAVERIVQDNRAAYKPVHGSCSTLDTVSYLSLPCNSEPPCKSKTSKYASHADSICLSTYSLHTSVTAVHATHYNTNKESNCLVSVLKDNFILFKNTRFLVIFGFTFFGIIGTCLFPAFIPPLAKEQGLTDVEAAQLVSLYACLDFISRLLSGAIAEHPLVNRRCMLIVMFLVLGVIYQFTTFYSNYLLMVMFVVIFGLVNGAYAAIHPPLILDFLGAQHFSKVFGFVQVFHGAALSASFPLLGHLRDLTGTYVTSFYVLGASQFIAAVFLLLEPLTKP